MTLQDFASANDVGYETVRIYIKRHGLETVKDAHGRVILPDATVEALEKQYHHDQPVQVIEDPELLKRIVELQDRVIGLQEQLQQATARLADKKASERLLEAAQANSEQLRQDSQRQHDQIVDLTAERDQLAQEVDRLKHRTLWERICNR